MSPPPAPLIMPPEVRASIRFTLGLYGPAEARHALAALRAGAVDGGTYGGRGPCCCLIGQLAVGRLLEHGEPDPGNLPLHDSPRLEAVWGIKKPGTEEAEKWFANIRVGDTPARSEHAHLAAECIQTWLDEVSPTLDLAPQNPLLQPESTRQAIAHLLREA